MPTYFQCAGGQHVGGPRAPGQRGRLGTKAIRAIRAALGRQDSRGGADGAELQGEWCSGENAAGWQHTGKQGFLMSNVMLAA
eukprot:scaffold278223_cov24-Tisochrysis_lutea.AAC.2